MSGNKEASPRPAGNGTSTPSSSIQEVAADLDGHASHELWDEEPTSIIPPNGPTPDSAIQFHGTPQDFPVSDPSIIGTSSFNRDYETALNVLVSLGNDPGTPMVWGASGKHDSAESPNVLTTDVDALPELFPTCAHAPQAPSIRLLRHYRYSIAPWVRPAHTTTFVRNTRLTVMIC